MNQTASDREDTPGTDSPSNREIQARVQGMKLVAGTRTLLENANAEFGKGKITLIVGPSGVGKSLFLKTLSGIQKNDADNISYEGVIEVEGKPTVVGNSAFVFQSFALLDEFSPKGNVQFAVAHRSGDSSRKRSAAQLLKDLDVPTRVPTSRLSGGQRQRLAIARALAYGKPTLFFDEPTAGLDIGTARKVARLIQDTATRNGTTAIIVTHDYESLVPIADEIFFLDPNSKSLDRVAENDWDTLHERLDELSTASTIAEERQASETPGLLQRCRQSIASWGVSTTRGLEEVVLLPYRLLPLWRSPVWGGRFFLHFLNLISGVTAILYLVVAGLILGFVTTYFTFEYLPFRQFSLPLVIEDILAAVGFGLFRIVIPVIGTVLIAARCGSAVTADVGSKEYGNQLDAMRSLKASPERYLLTNILYSFLIGAPLLIFFSFQAAKWISLIVFLGLFPNESADYWHQYFHRTLEVDGSFFYEGTAWVFAKVLICGVGVGMISYAVGTQTKLSSNDVSSSVTRTTLYATLFVLAVHFAFAFYEFNRLE